MSESSGKSPLPDFKSKLPPKIAEMIAPSAPIEKKLLVAKGVVPIPPDLLITVLTYLSNDHSEEVKETATRELLGIPSAMAQSALNKPCHPKTLDFFSRHKLEDEKLMEVIALNKYTTDETLAHLAEKGAARITEIIVNNQTRLLESPHILEKLKLNPNSSKSAIDQTVSFLRINGVAIEGETGELSDEEVAAILNMEDVGFDFPDNLIREKSKDEAVTEEEIKSIYKLVQTLNVSGKVKLALKGNKEARSLLIKDSNKVVCSAVVKSPRITEMEILNICNMRTIQDEIIRIICAKPEWTKNYTIQVALANNPKTPFQTALRFARMMRIADLQKLSKNKNAPPQLVKLAKEIYNQKRK